MQTSRNLQARKNGIFNDLIRKSKQQTARTTPNTYSSSSKFHPKIPVTLPDTTEPTESETITLV
uniref:Putative ovule protein n=1 Tax=Solanum chacoense TaxID=4108 RepID=A0A0V0GTN0_SOLCH